MEGVSRSRIANQQKLNGDRMNALRRAADPKIDRDVAQQEAEDVRLWEEEQRVGVVSANLPRNQKTDLLSNVLKKAKEAAGLCFSELPKEFFETEDAELKVWAALVNDDCLRKLARSNATRIRDGVVAGSQRKAVDPAKGAVGLMSSLFPGGVKGGEPIRVPFAGIRSLIIPNAVDVTDAGLLSLANTCTSLKRLNIAGCHKLTDIAVRALAKRNLDLEEVNLSHCENVQGGGLVTIGECCPKLTILRLRQCPASEEWLLKRIATGLPELKELDLSYCFRVSDETLRTIANRCNKLEKVVISHCQLVSDVGILALSEWCPGLEYLDLTRTKLKYKITDVCMLSLAERCTCMTTLLLSGNELLSDVGVCWLASGCHALRKLSLAKCFKVTDTGLRALGDGCPDLEWVDFSGMNLISDVGLRYLGFGCRKLKHINLTNVYLLTDGSQRDFGKEGLQYLADECLELSSIILTGCFQVGARTLNAFSKGTDPLSELPSFQHGQSLSTLVLCRVPKINAKMLEPIFKGRSRDTLVRLDLSFCENVTDKVLSLVGRHCCAIKVLKVSKCEKVTTRGVAALCRGGNAKTLEDLDVSWCKMSDLCLLAISEAGFDPGLRRLNLKGCPDINETGVAWLASKVPSLYEINLKGCEGVSLTGLKSIVGSWKFCVIRNDTEFFGISPDSKCIDMRFIDEYGAVWKAATLIQNTYRAKLARREAEKQREIRLMNWTARRLQSIWRGRIARRYAILKKLQRDREVEAAIRLQCAFRSRVARKRALVEQERMYQLKCERSAIYIQTRWRGRKCRDVLQAARKARNEYMKKCEACALKMQRLWRGLKGRRKFGLMKTARLAKEAEEEAAAIKIQALARGRKARRDIAARKRLDSINEEQKEKATRVLQRGIRARLARKRLNQKKDEQFARERAAIKLQCMWRNRQGSLAVHILKQARRNAKLEAAALKVQCAWRKKQGRVHVHLLKAAKKMKETEETEAAQKLQCMFRRRQARKKLFTKKEEKIELVRRQEDLEDWAALKVQKVYRGKAGRRRATIIREEKKKRWKEMFDYEQDRIFYYNQDSGEVRWRKPQDLLDLLPKPSCNNCNCGDEKKRDIVVAILECGVCTEYFCEKCWENVHHGGLRKDHMYRPLYDAYGKRIEYGDGEWPSVWPSEIEQDDILGWQRIQRAEQAARGEVVTVGIPEMERKMAEEASSSEEEEEEEEEEEKEEKETVKWRKLWDNENECEIYIHMIKHKVAFERPKGYISPREEDCWQKYFDDNYECDYYYNTKTGETTYETPEVLMAKEDIPCEWEKIFDHDTGKAFYHNCKTGVSLSERPAEYFTPREERAKLERLKLEQCDWAMYYDEDSEKNYYYNYKTGATQFDRPPAYHTPREDMWRKFFDDDERPYYYNEVTMESQYMRPPDYETPRMEGLEEGANGWVKYPDPESGQMVYENTETGAVQWERPSDFVEVGEQVDQSQFSWERFWDDSSEAHYYWNSITGETTYEKPEGFTEELSLAQTNSSDLINQLQSEASAIGTASANIQVNEDWSESGIYYWLRTFVAQEDVLEMKTPVLRPDVRDLVIAACDEFDLDTVTHGFGKMRTILITKVID